MKWFFFLWIQLYCRIFVMLRHAVPGPQPPSLAAPGITSPHWRVFGEQSGFTHRRSAGMRWAAFCHQLHDVRLGGDVGRVDVVHAGADLVGVLEVLEGVQQLHVRARGLERDGVGASMSAMAAMMSLNSE